MELTKLSSGNFYFNLAQKLAKYIAPKFNREKISASFQILDNSVEFSYGNDELVVKINGKKFTGKGKGIRVLEEVIEDIFRAEAHGDVTVTRDKGSYISDRSEFNRAKGTLFPRIYKSVVWNADGTKNSEVSGSRNKAIALTERQYRNATSVKSFKSENFHEVSCEAGLIYVNNDAEFIDFTDDVVTSNPDLTPEDISTDFFLRILTNSDRYSGYWARTQAFDKLIKNINSFINTVVSYKNRVWIVIPESNP